MNKAEEELYDALVGVDRPLEDAQFEVILEHTRNNGTYITRGLEIMSDEQKVILLTEIEFLIVSKKKLIQEQIDRRAK